MKKSLIATALLVASAFAGVVGAADGTLNFTGSITDDACTVDAGSASQSIAMGTVSSDALNAVGAAAAPTRFSVVLTSCPAAVTNVSLKFDGPIDANDSKLLALAGGTGAATGVGIGFYERDATTQIPVGTASASQTVAQNGTTLHFIAKYVATDATVVAGTAQASTSFTLNYN